MTLTLGDVGVVLGVQVLNRNAAMHDCLCTLRVETWAEGLFPSPQQQSWLRRTGSGTGKGGKRKPSPEVLSFYYVGALAEALTV